MEKIIKLTNITKKFPGLVAHDNINLEIEKGEIHAIVGENGAGKSTLMKILSGLYQPDSGEIYIKGKKVIIRNPRHAIKLGIGMVHQHFMLVSRFTILDNIILGSEKSKAGLIDYELAEKEVTDLLKRYNFELDIHEEVGSLSVGQQQRVEILKVLYRGADILVLDEPTAVLAPQEVKELFINLRKLKEQGKTILFISHKLDEVLEIADTITVLRKGRLIKTLKRNEVKDKSELAELMVGRPVILKYSKEDIKRGKPLIEVKELIVKNESDRRVLNGVSFSVYAGEIYGIAGIEGNGQKELVDSLMGLLSKESGEILLNNVDIKNLNVNEIKRIGVGFISEDRHKEGLVLPMTVWENSVLGYHRDREFGLWYRLNVNRIIEHCDNIIKNFDVRLSSMFIPIKGLSGGNQQKIILGRELIRNPKIIIASQPTRGLDIGASEFVHQLLIKARDEGCAILLISADLEEILALSDRIGVIYNGEIVAEFESKEATPDEIGYYMTGGKRKVEV